MKIIFFIFTFTIYLHASTINLDEIMQKIKTQHPMQKSIQAYQYAYGEQNNANSSREALLFSADGTYAKPDLDDAGYEYSIGIEQNFMNPTVQENIQKSAQYQSDANILRLKHDFLVLQNDVKLLYHINCLDKNTLQEYKASYTAFELLYKKKEKAYSFGEISKKELLQLQIELQRIKNQYRHYESEVLVSRNNLQSKILLPFFDNKELFCEDIDKVQEELVLFKRPLHSNTIKQYG